MLRFRSGSSRCSDRPALIEGRGVHPAFSQLKLTRHRMRVTIFGANGATQPHPFVFEPQKLFTTRHGLVSVRMKNC